jgi:hypothetical protein
LQFRNFLFPDIQIVSDGFCLIVQQIISSHLSPLFWT